MTGLGPTVIQPCKLATPEIYFPGLIPALLSSTDLSAQPTASSASLFAKTKALPHDFAARARCSRHQCHHNRLSRNTYVGIARPLPRQVLPLWDEDDSRGNAASGPIPVPAIKMGALHTPLTDMIPPHTPSPPRRKSSNATTNIVSTADQLDSGVRSPTPPNATRCDTELRPTIPVFCACLARWMMTCLPAPRVA